MSIMTKSSLGKMDGREIKKFLLSKSVLIVLILFAAVMGFIYPEFLSFSNISNMLQDISMYGVAACGMTILIIGGDFDLSASSQYAWAMILCISMTSIVGPVAAMLITLISGIVLGIVNGLLVAKVNLNSFTATLGTQLVIRGLCLAYTGGQMINTQNETFTAIGNYKLLGFSSLTYVYFVAIVIVSFVLYKTRFGRNLYAVGGNAQVAKFAGINTGLTKIAGFACMGLLCAIAGLMFVAQMRAGSVLYGTDLTMSCVAATVIGGTSLSGGSGNVVRTLIGMILINVLYKALIFLGLSSYLQDMTKGIVVILVVVFDYFTSSIGRRTKSVTV